MLKDLSVYVVTWNVCGQQPVEDLHSLLHLPNDSCSLESLPHLYAISDSDNSDVEYEPMESDNETIDSYESDDVLSEHEDDSVMLSDSWKRIADIFSDCRPNSLPELVRNFSGINPALNCNANNSILENFKNLQEVNSQPQNMFLDMLFNDPWTQAFTNLLKKYNYMRLKIERLQGIMLMIFIKRDLITHITGLETEFTRVGLGGMWGNKGAVSIRFNINGCSVCLINSHLSAHLDEIEKRINEYSLILDGQSFNDPQTEHIITHDYVFWCGDLNFRIQDLTAEKVNALIHSKKFEKLLEYDQLRKVMKSGDAFSEFKEADPTFPPSYKLIVNRNEYDLNRVPSWTDRIMHRLTPNAYDGVLLETKQLDYRSHLSYKQSDHKPVSSHFIIKVFDKITDALVQFYSIDNWWTNTDNVAFYKIANHFKPTNYDWIGLYKHDFMSVNEYLCYIWAPHKPISNHEANNESNSSEVSVSQQRDSMLPVYRAVITDQSVILPGRYRLAYISTKSMNVLGVSEPFEVF
ncbi:Phosphatidylinositol 4,5-bisphosphate 5-phosphatase A [Nymphon striatum]|nr:Phosphatidylinositol 4,5-bisphosphate 5-phosphatase A [Nymphon striatum]